MNTTRRTLLRLLASVPFVGTAVDVAREPGGGGGDPLPYQSAIFEDAPLSEKELLKFAKMGQNRKWQSS